MCLTVSCPSEFVGQKRAWFTALDGLKIVSVSNVTSIILYNDKSLDRSITSRSTVNT